MARSNTSSGPGLLFWLGLALIVILADQVTKTLIIGQFALGDVRPVTGYFNLVRAHNAGAAFSFLNDASGWQRWFFIIVGLVTSGIIVWMIRNSPTQKLFCFGVTMILGGALGNVIDRMIHGHVVDFLQFRFAVLEPLFPGGYFPSFNVADSAITWAPSVSSLTSCCACVGRSLSRLGVAPWRPGGRCLPHGGRTGVLVQAGLPRLPMRPCPTAPCPRAPP
jgi:signal peptidase II